MKEARDTTIGKMGEYKDNTKETAREAKDYTADKAKEAKDYTADKAKETKDYTVDKSAQGKDNAVGKLSELKDKAMHLFTGKKNETGESGDFVKTEMEEEARRKLETMHLKDQRYEAKGTGMDAASATVAKVDPLRATAETFRKADQMSGQAFNDVGVMDEGDDAKGVRSQGGVYRVQLKHEKK
ncbi:putative Late embryogenesis abundant protein, LEA_4 subgroup [Helianthus annuus]|nr:putative Late embryogenesis abundant protein, LEA_4 subgroup [Helianthus annuus]KAJ0632895.1 putative Late embryogenesis abundant protein, LEA_4 subgroup [Helianthus annuus]KAJ0826883.1 putative Late embryogenesis abundant protein, LEA_4 subgroup [Helianthus annuus]